MQGGWRGKRAFLVTRFTCAFFPQVKFARDSGSDGHSVSSRDSAAPSPVPGADGPPADPTVSAPTSVPFKSGWDAGVVSSPIIVHKNYSERGSEIGV